MSSADAARARRRAQENIRRRCTCGRIVAGNPGWWSHTNHPDGTPRDGHAFAGRA